MSQRNKSAATPARRSERLSQAGSIAQSAITTFTNGGTKSKKRAPLAKVNARKSNTYGSSGRVGQAEGLVVHATGFVEAFEEQRIDAVAREPVDDEEEEEEEEDEEDDVDELGAQTLKMSGGLNGFPSNRLPSFESDVQTPAPTSHFFNHSDAGSASESDYPTSAGNTSKSFGLNHEAGMLGYRPQQPIREQSNSPWKAPLWQKNKDRDMRRRQQQRELTDFYDEEDAEKEAQPAPKPFVTQGLPKKTPATSAVKNTTATQGVAQKNINATPSLAPKSSATPAKKAAIEKSVNDLVAEEQERVVPSGPHVQPANDPPAAAQWFGNVDPGAYNFPDLPWKELGTWLLGILFGGFVLLQILQLMTSTQYPETTRRHGVMSAVSTRIEDAWYNLADWIMPDEHPSVAKQKDEVFKWGDGTLDDNLMWSRIRRVYEEFDGRMGDMKETIKDLNEQLPDMMVVRRRPDGRREITDDFWHALLDRANSSGNDAEWAEFVNKNKVKLQDLFGVPKPVGGTGAVPEAVSRQEFVRFVQEHYQKISEEVDKKVFEAVQGQAARIATIAQEEARKAIVDSIRLQSLAQSNLLANYELNFRKTNYFSSGLGAVIEPDLTSTTFLDNPQWHSRFARRLARVPLRNPPLAALEKWDEPGECWCAAPNPSNKGQAQLTVSLPEGVFPEQITIEHLPKDMMPGKKITNAPRTMELWVETDQPAEYQYAHREDACGPGPDGWTCLGAFTYNIHASNHQQTFDLDAYSTVPVTKAMVRVTSNWGADHTCLYRVRMHGRDAVAEHEYDVRVNDPA